MSSTQQKYANDIASVVIQGFEMNKLKGKPVPKSNGVEEWTILAGIVGIFGSGSSSSSQYDKMKLVSLATGVKAIPVDILKKHSDGGRILHDCHAEVLCMRGFNWFIAQEARKLHEGEESEYLQLSANSRYEVELKESIRFGIYASEVPCGDASLEQLIEEGDAKWEVVTELPGNVLRGREDFMTQGRVRTKPGRRDSPLCLSMSCSDKIASKQFTSLLNGLTSSYCDPRGCYLDALVVPESKFNQESLTRAFHDRLDVTPDIKHSYHPLDILSTDVDEYSFAKNETKKSPSNISLVFIPDYNLNEAIVNGVKEGFYTKKSYLRRNGESQLSRRRLWEASLIAPMEGDTYYGLKRKNIEHVERREHARKALGGWCLTTEDDIEIL